LFNSTEIMPMRKGKNQEWKNRYDNPIKMVTASDMVPLISIKGLKMKDLPNKNVMKMK